MEQNETVHIHFANGAQYGPDETSLISSEVECMGLYWSMHAKYEVSISYSSKVIQTSRKFLELTRHFCTFVEI